MAASSTPPKTMTWPKATPIIVVAFMFDALRAFFSMLFLFAPALIDAYVATKTAAVAGTGTVGSWFAGLLGGGAAGASGYFGFGAFLAIGEVMAMAIGFLGWLTVICILALTNTRIFKANVWSFVWFLASLGASEVPFVSALPALSITTIKMYHTQIKKEKKELREWQANSAQTMQTERRQQAAQYLAARTEAPAAESEAPAEEEQTEVEEEADEELQNSYDSYNTYQPGTLPDTPNENEEIPEDAKVAA